MEVSGSFVFSLIISHNEILYLPSFCTMLILSAFWDYYSYEFYIFGANYSIYLEAKKSKQTKLFAKLIVV